MVEALVCHLTGVSGKTPVNLSELPIWKILFLCWLLLLWLEQEQLQGLRGTTGSPSCAGRAAQALVLMGNGPTGCPSS